MNTNTAEGNFGVYEIYKNGELYKIGKADLNRVTKKSGQPTRLHQQLERLRNPKNNPDGDVFTAKVVDKGHKTTASAKAAEKARLDDHHRATGNIPDGNTKSYKAPQSGGGRC